MTQDGGSSRHGPFSGGHSVYLASKSPSVPNLTQRFTRKTVRQVSPERPKSQFSGLLQTEDSTNLSVIDLYGDEEEELSLIHI